MRSLRRPIRKLFQMVLGGLVFVVSVPSVQGQTRVEIYDLPEAFNDLVYVDAIDQGICQVQESYSFSFGDPVRDSSRNRDPYDTRRIAFESDENDRMVTVRIDAETKRSTQAVKISFKAFPSQIEKIKKSILSGRPGSDVLLTESLFCDQQPYLFVENFQRIIIRQ
ncbi:MAG: hypothetical protein CL675_04355 [Bdellovibrionaceae bacterium]|nr:hypothetical protein [Pseudobdellovibrionaceae bacterium]